MSAPKRCYGPWSYIRDVRPPDMVAVIFLCIYPNGSTVQAVGYRNGRKYEIEWSSDHPSEEDILFWMPFTDDPFGPLRINAASARAHHDAGLRP